MSENRGITGLSNNEGKTMNSSDVEEEEEEEEAKAVSEEQSSTSTSSTTVVAADQEVFHEMIAKPYGVENGVTPIKKRGHFCISQDHEPSPIDATSKSKSRNSTKRNKEELDGKCSFTSLSESIPNWSCFKKRGSAPSSLTKVGINAGQKQKILLFEKTLTPSDINLNLYIPKEEALAHFPSIETWEGTFLQFLDFQNKKWPMKFMYSRGSKAYKITAGWKEFVNAHNLQATDMIQFYKRNDEYFIDGVKGKKTETDMILSASPDSNNGVKNDGNSRDDSQNGGSSRGGGDRLSLDGSCKSSVLENENTAPVKMKMIRLFGKNIYEECRSDNNSDESDSNTF